MKKNPYS